MNKQQITKNQDWHLQYWEDDYNDIPKKFASILFMWSDLHKRFYELEKKIKAIEISRREHAVSMGVGIARSDEIFSCEEQLKTIPEVMQSMEEFVNKFGIKLPSADDIKNGESHE